MLPRFTRASRGALSRLANRPPSIIFTCILAYLLITNSESYKTRSKDQENHESPPPHK